MWLGDTIKFDLAKGFIGPGLRITAHGAVRGFPVEESMEEGHPNDA